MNNNDYLKNLAKCEQAAAEMRPIAAMLSTYFNSLTECGFSRSESLQLVIALQGKVFETALNLKMPNDDEDGE